MKYDSLHGQIVEQSYALLNRAALHFKQPVPEIAIHFDLRGEAAGMVRVLKKRPVVIRYNPILLIENPDDFLSQTVPHEIAHVVAHSMHRRRILPHGPEWQRVMAFFGAANERCHNYDTRRSSARRLKRFSYHCDCREHQLTSIRHNRIINGQNYFCRCCKQSLKPTAP